MVLDLVARVSKTSRQAHFAHWATHSYAIHQALGSFYPSVIETLDSFIENYQAYFSLIGPVTVEAFETPRDILTVLKDDIRWLNSNRDGICNKISSLQNIFDELTSTYTSTVYKLINLK